MKNRQQIIIILAVVILTIILGVAFFLTGATPAVEGSESSATLREAAMAYCNDRNNRYEIQRNPGGSEQRVCILADGTECLAWDFYRGNCPTSTGPGDASTDPWAAHCLAKNYTYTIRENTSGTLDHLCVFPDDRVCDVHDYYLRTCNETTARAP